MTLDERYPQATVVIRDSYFYPGYTYRIELDGKLLAPRWLLAISPALAWWWSPTLNGAFAGARIRLERAMEK
jgi:hypothetical protein